MTLEEIIDTILNSNTKDWNQISCWGYGSGPSYKNSFPFYEMFNGVENVLKSESHSDICVYKKNLSITMAYGYETNPDYKEDWANQFPNPSANSNLVDIFYNNALVFRESYLVVDGGRCILPIPSYDSNSKLSVSNDYYSFIKFLQLLSSRSESTQFFDSYFSKTGIEVKSTPWI